MTELFETIEFARITPDAEHLNAVDSLALDLFLSGVISADQVRQASQLARTSL